MNLVEREERRARLLMTQKNFLAKVLRYFPLKPRLQQMFLSSKIDEHMQ